MKALMITAVLLIPSVAAADAYPIDEMKQKCEKERTSSYRANNGTPTCDRLDKIRHDYDQQTQNLTKDLREKCYREENSMFRENNGTPSCARLNEQLRDRSEKSIDGNSRQSR